MSARYWFNRIPPRTKRELCRVSYCPEPIEVYPSGLVAQHGFCHWHVALAPAAFKRRWANATSLLELRRVWDELADDFEFEERAREHVA